MREIRHTGAGQRFFEEYKDEIIEKIMEILRKKIVVILREKLWKFWDSIYITGKFKEIRSTGFRYLRVSGEYKNIIIDEIVNIQKKFEEIMTLMRYLNCENQNMKMYW